MVRLQLNKQIQELERYISDVERKKSHFSASTATHSFPYGTPQTSSFSVDPIQFDPQVHLHNEPNGYENWNSSSVSFSSVNSFGVSSGSLEREPYIPKIIEVNYIEGSNDQKWSSRDFTWTKKLEVPVLIVNKFPQSIQMIFLTFVVHFLFRQITRRYLGITRFAPTRERLLMLQ